MSYRQLEEAINKWTLELEEQEKHFLNQATQVNAWDRLLMTNGEKIVKLHESVEKVKLDQQVILDANERLKLLAKLDLTHSFFREISFKKSCITYDLTDFSMQLCYTCSRHDTVQCGNYGNSLSRIFGKNFVKVTALLNIK